MGISHGLLRFFDRRRALLSGDPFQQHTPARSDSIMAMNADELKTIDFGSIPQALTDLNQWVLWKTVVRDGNATKMPLSVFGRAASSTSPADWTSFDNVVGKFDEAQHSGIGFVFTATDGLCGIDLDGCRDPQTGTIADWATDEILRFSSYTEISPSQTGLKIWIHCDTVLPKGRKKEIRRPQIVAKMPAVEVYSQGRYFAVTGQVHKRYSRVEPRETQLQEFLLHHWTDAPSTDRPATDWRSDDAVVERARKYLHRVPGAVAGGGGHNATFAAACTLVKGFELSESQALDVLIEWNTRCVPPWSEHELQHKIRSAADASGEVGYLRNSKPERWDSIRSPEVVATQNTAHGKTKPSREFNFSDQHDIGNATDFAAVYADDLRYCSSWAKWLAWDGARWKIDTEDRALRLAMEHITDVIHRVVIGRLDKSVLAFAVKSANVSRLRAMVALAGASMPICVDDLDRDSWALNCLNGTVNLKTGKLRKHQRTDNLTKVCPTEFQPDAESPVWAKFLRDVFADDVELIQFAQRLFGQYLTGDVSEQKLAIFHGTGANGKSTLLNAFMDAVGPDYAMQCMPDFLMEKKGDSHPTEKASLFGKRFVSCVETEASRKLAESTVKALTGGEKIMARRMREDFWEFSPTHKLALCTNHRPVISGTDHGIWRRLLLVPFLQRFDGERQDKQLSEKLQAERSGILAWAVRGCLEWQRAGLNPPGIVSNATADYRSSEDILGRFVADCCLVEPAGSVRFSVLYERLEAWSRDGGEETPAKKAVGTFLEEQGHQKYSANGRCYRGLMMAPNA